MSALSRCSHQVVIVCYLNIELTRWCVNLLLTRGRVVSAVTAGALVTDLVLYVYIYPVCQSNKSAYSVHDMILLGTKCSCIHGACLLIFHCIEMHSYIDSKVMNFKV